MTALGHRIIVMLEVPRKIHYTDKVTDIDVLYCASLWIRFHISMKPTKQIQWYPISLDVQEIVVF